MIRDGTRLSSPLRCIGNEIGFAFCVARALTLALRTLERFTLALRHLIPTRSVSEGNAVGPSLTLRVSMMTAEVMAYATQS